MNPTFTDDSLRSWEVFSTSGRYGLAVRPRIVFQCLSDPSVRPRFLEVPRVEAEAVARAPSPERLRELFRRARALD